MDLDRENVISSDQSGGRKTMRGKGSTIVGGSRRSESVESNRSSRHIIAKNFHAIEINDCAVIALELRAQVGDRTGIGDVERAAIIISDESGRVGGRLTAIAKAQLGGPRDPTGIGKARGH